MDSKQLLDKWKEQQRQWTVKQKLALLGLGWLFVLVLLYFFVLVPQQEVLQERTSRLQAVTVKNTRLETFRKDHPDVSVYWGELDSELAAVSLQIPDHNDLSGILFQVDQVAKKNNLELARIKPGAPINQKNYREIPLELDVRGMFFDTMHFLQDLEKTTRLANVVVVDTQAKQDKLQTKVVVVVYSYGILPNSPATSQPSKPAGAAKEQPINTVESAARGDSSSAKPK
ncbi:MAG: type 4a pilus biogenesis protein PilO [Sporomusaceae bacterium]|nr:type 4a pilus biogenesis protein PilO [Sporomusaceae bacterium]